MRRASFLTTTGASAALAGLAAGVAQAAPSAAADGAKAQIAKLLGALPGTKAASIFTSDNSFDYALNPTTRLVIASTFKVFVAVSALQLVEEGKASLDEMLPLDESVYIPGSTAFTPALKGKVPMRVAIQEMIAYSDNCATDMVMKRVGVSRIRAFIAFAGLTSVQIPDSTRAFFSYTGGYPKGVNAPYEVLYGLKKPPANLRERPVNNDVVTIKAAMGQLASFYQRAIRGDFFKKPATMIEFECAMNNGKLVELSAPLGSQIFTKAGSFNSGGHNGLVTAGAAQTLDKYIYYAIGCNWIDDTKGAFEKMGAHILETSKQILTLVRSVQFA